MNTEKPLQDAVKHHIDEKDALNRKAQAANCAATVLADECGKLRKRVAELETELRIANQHLSQSVEDCEHHRVTEALKARIAELVEIRVDLDRQIRVYSAELAAERAAHMETRKKLEQLAGCAAEYLSTRKRDVLEDLEVAIDAAKEGRTCAECVWYGTAACRHGEREESDNACHDFQPRAAVAKADAKEGQP